MINLLQNWSELTSLRHSSNRLLIGAALVLGL